MRLGLTKHDKVAVPQWSRCPRQQPCNDTPLRACGASRLVHRLACDSCASDSRSGSQRCVLVARSQCAQWVAGSGSVGRAQGNHSSNAVNKGGASPAA